MNVLQTIIRKKQFIALFAVSITGFGISAAHAGFEWIPQKQQAVENPVIAPTAPFPQAIPLMPVDNTVLPLPLPPSDLELQEPIVIPPQATIQTAPPPMPLAPLGAPARIAVMPNEAPNSGVIVNSEPPAPAPTPMPLADVVQTQQAEDPALLVKPPMMPRNAHIIMPDDAPQAAVDQANKNSMAITAFPSQQELITSRHTPMPSFDAPAMPAPPQRGVIQPIAPPAQPDFAEAVGFASDVPLALALRQVVPADYAFSFGNGVNPGLRVSWNGGRPWDDVIASMIDPLGYTLRISQRTVTILEQGAAAAATTGTFTAPMPVAVPMPVPAFLEPAAGDAAADADLPALISVQDAQTSALKDVERGRNIKRIHVADPGAQTSLTQQPFTISSADRVESRTASPRPTQRQAIPTAAPEKISFWTAEAGSSLKETLLKWGQAANSEIVWDSAHDYQLSADFEVQGSFEKAIDLLLKHGVQNQGANLSYSYSASSKSDGVTITVENNA